MVHQMHDAVGVEVGEYGHANCPGSVDGKEADSPAGSILGTDGNLVPLGDPGLREHAAELRDIDCKFFIGNSFTSIITEGGLLPLRNHAPP